MNDRLDFDANFPGEHYHHADASRIDRLIQRRRGELWRLWFKGGDEALYRDAANRWRARWRSQYLLWSAAFIFAVLLTDHLLLDPPQAYLELRWLVGLGGMIPALLLAMAVTGRRHTRRYAEPAIALAMAVCSLGVIYERQVGYSMGIVIPVTWIAMPVVVGLLLCRIRLVLFMPVQILIVIAGVAGELALGQTRSEMYAQIHTIGLVFAVVVGVCWLLEYYNRSTWLRREWLVQLSSRDHLTGLLNKRSFNQEFRRLFALARKERRPLTVAMIDVDHFKAYNDHYGHQAGDRCLKLVADCLSARARRGGDLAGRVGGEEFALIWYGNERESVQAMLEGLLQAVRELNIAHAHTGTGTDTVTVTVSIGAHWQVPDVTTSAAAMLHRADMLLYRAKDEGRNRLMMD